MESRLARLEEKIDHLITSMDRFVDTQGKHNVLFYQTRDEVIVIKASAKAAWFTLTVFGAVVVTLSGGLAWVVTTLITKGHI